MTLHELNTLPGPKLAEALLTCCGSAAWVERMLPLFPADDLVDLLENAEEQWWRCSASDWKEAFAAHPKIGDLTALQKKFSATATWATDEQGGVRAASPGTIEALAEGNRRYEERFGYIFIICATGKSADEMLAALTERLKNDPRDEIEIAADEQNKITRLRIEKLLNP